ncbi:ABC transporter ATP-binding protein [Aeromicrobium sp. CTD01-1L150]|uniref:ABC transporter ATP-binding protein n=1 Tax=Aeromicrobium sp. CTD01-1L150 TaxID=3341830 RepID=UPI0035BF04E0
MAESRSSAASIRTTGLTVRYGRALALVDVDVDAPPSEVTAIIGSNGAGKSTLLKTIVGMVPVEAGSVLIDDEDVTTAGTTAVIDRGVALVPEGRRLFGDLTVEENLRVGGFRLRGTGSERVTIDSVLEYFPELLPKLKVRAHHLSGGQQQMVAIARALMSRPRLLMLDEPCAGLAPVVVKRIAGLFEDIAATGVTVVLVEQNAVVALDVSSRCHVLETGRVVLAGASADLRKSEFVANAYLGV